MLTIKNRSKSLPSVNSRLTSCEFEGIAGDKVAGGAAELDNLRMIFHSKREKSFEVNETTCSKNVPPMTLIAPKNVNVRLESLYLGKYFGRKFVSLR